MPNYDAIVIGSGFGGAVAVTKLVKKARESEPKRSPRILVLERGTWWRNPEGPGLRKFNDKKTPKIRGEWQYWARPRDSYGLTSVANSIYKATNAIWDFFNVRFKDNDLGVEKNVKGMYRLTRFTHDKGKVDVVSGSAVGGGSLFYSGVNLIPHAPVLERIGLGHLTSADFQRTGDWMKEFRGSINKINTKLPVPHYLPTQEEISNAPRDFFQLGAIPESGDAVPDTSSYERPEPILTGKADEDYVLLDRARVLKRAMERVQAKGGFDDGGEVYGRGLEALPLSVVEYEPPKQEGDESGRFIENPDSNKNNTYCTREGACILGCLPSARHTLYKTIRKEQANPEGALIDVLPLTVVSHINRNSEGTYQVHYTSAAEETEGDRGSAEAPVVFVAGGSLGTSEVLLRTKEKYEESGGQEGLALSDTVGGGFSTNGDFFGFTYNIPRDFKTRKHVHENPNHEQHPRIGNPNPTMGPINSSHFYLTYGEGSNRVEVNVEDAGIPPAFARLVHNLLPHFGTWKKLKKLAKAVLKIILGRDPFSRGEAPDTEDREQDAYMTERELVSNVFFYNMMGAGPNEPLGKFRLQKDGVGLDLDYDQELGDWEVFRKQVSVMKQLTNQMNDPGDTEDDGTERKAKLMLSPFWSKENRVTVVHPLGGAVIGTDQTLGTVDSFGRVYDASADEPTAVHDNLFVVDSAVIPGALGVNPTYTIATQAIRSVDEALRNIDTSNWPLANNPS